MQPLDTAMTTRVHDFSLGFGERQIASEYAAIRADHRHRYEWADACLPRAGAGVDAFCGNGYGTWLLSGTRWVLGIDGSEEAIAMANRCYRRPTTMFSAQEFPFELPTTAFDFAVALESIEHVADDALFMRTLVKSLRVGGLLVFSTPCEDHLPLASTGNHFHHRHYSLRETLELPGRHGLVLQQWAGQDVYRFTEDGRQGPLLEEADMQLRVGEPGQFLIVACRKLMP